MRSPNYVVVVVVGKLKFKLSCIGESVGGKLIGSDGDGLNVGWKLTGAVGGGLNVRGCGGWLSISMWTVLGAFLSKC